MMYKNKIQSNNSILSSITINFITHHHQLYHNLSFLYFKLKTFITVYLYQLYITASNSLTIQLVQFSYAGKNCVCVCVCVCVRERERERRGVEEGDRDMQRQRQREGKRERQTDRQTERDRAVLEFYNLPVILDNWNLCGTTKR